MAPPRKPSNILELKGSFKKNPRRGVEREHEPEPVGEIGDAPASLDEREKACWQEIVKMCHAGSLCAADALILEHGARVLAALRSNPVYEDVKLMVRLEATLGKLGLTPADRSKVQVIKAKEVENPFAKFKAAT